MRIPEVWRDRLMDSVESLRAQSAEWSDEYLLSQFSLGSNAFAEDAAFEAIRTEVARRGIGVQGTPVSEAAPVATAKPIRRDLLKLWRGELPLATTYWAWGVLGNAIYFALISMAWSLAQSGGRLANLLAIVALAPTATNYIYYFAVTFSIWRSAGRYAGPRVWAFLARIMVAVSLFVTIGRLV